MLGVITQILGEFQTGQSEGAIRLRVPKSIPERVYAHRTQFSIHVPVHIPHDRKNGSFTERNNLLI